MDRNFPSIGDKGMGSPEETPKKNVGNNSPNPPYSGGSTKPFETKEVVFYRDGDFKGGDDKVVFESPVTIYFNGTELVTLLCTPLKLDYLVLGFLRSEGFIESKSDVTDIQVDPKKGAVAVESREKKELAEKLYGRRTVTTGCGKGTTFFTAWDSLRSRPVKSDFEVGALRILSLMGQMQKKAEIFKETGGLHSAALCSSEELLFFSEDVGRHNALDKIVGETLWHELELKDKILISSGRISSEMMLKAAKLEVPIVVSRSAPTELGINIAQKMEITLVGFARGRRLNIYNRPDRVT